jgi:hypothetical protein
MPPAVGANSACGCAHDNDNNDRQRQQQHSHARVRAQGVFIYMATNNPLSPESQRVLDEVLRHYGIVPKSPTQTALEGLGAAGGAAAADSMAPTQERVRFVTLDHIVGCADGRRAGRQRPIARR